MNRRFLSCRNGLFQNTSVFHELRKLCFCTTSGIAGAYSFRRSARDMFSTSACSQALFRYRNQGASISKFIYPLSPDDESFIKKPFYHLIPIFDLISIIRLIAHRKAATALLKPKGAGGRGRLRRPMVFNASRTSGYLVLASDRRD